MLKSLSTKLRDALERLAKGSPDKEAVEQLIKEIQRALLSADVDVKLVFELSENIRNRAFEKIPPAITRREYVIKVVYEELTRIMGEKKAIVELKSKKILLAGLFGSGKCVHKDSLIPVSDGRIEKIERIYEKYKIHGIEKEIDDGYVVELPKESAPRIFSFNPETLKIESKEISALWKRREKSLLKFTFDNGSKHEIIVTPEHPFFVLREGQIVNVRADELAEGSFVAIPNRIGIVDTNACINVYDKLPSDFVIINNGIAASLTNMLKKRYGTLEKSHKMLKLKMSYSRMTYILKRGIVPIHIIKDVAPELLENCKYIRIKSYGLPASGSQSQKYINLPSTMTKEFGEWLGYLIGEGYIGRRTVGITNTDEIILNRIIYLSESLFGIKAHVVNDKRNSVKVVQLNSKTLVRCLDALFDLKSGKKSSVAVIPELILLSSDEVLKAFIRAYFDGEGTVGKESRYIEIASASKVIIYQLAAALLRFGIVSAISSREIDGKLYWRLFIRGRFTEKFALDIGCLHPEKKRRLQRALEIGKHQTPGNKTELLNVGNMLKNVREAFGLSVGELQERVTSYGLRENSGIISRSSLVKFVDTIKSSKRRRLEVLDMAEKGVSSSKLRKIHNLGWSNATVAQMGKLGWLDNESGQIVLSQGGREILEAARNFEFSVIEWLDNLASSDLSWVKVKSVEAYTNDSEYVYDLTVDDFHNFVANGIIVHNTSTAAKLARFYQKRGLKPALVCCDTVRPAAYEQLKQLAEKIDVPFYGEKGKNDSSKVLKNALKKISADILVIDSSGRNALDQALVDEIKELNSILQPDEKILVIPADIGQAAKQQANAFHDALQITDVIVTKLDATAKGGGALTACYETGAKVKFITVGETVEDMELYDPEKFVARLLGMPDLETLLEKAKSAIDEKQAEKIIKGDFDLEDFYSQIEGMQKMGPLSGVFDMLGMGKMGSKFDLDIQETKMKKWKYAIQSMTREEKANPDIINSSRVRRIANGSGLQDSDVRELIGNYNKAKKMMKKISPGKLKRGGMAGLFRQFGMK